jgi:hypothetical protein
MTPIMCTRIIAFTGDQWSALNAARDAVAEIERHGVDALDRGRIADAVALLRVANLARDVIKARVGEAAHV